MKTVLMLIVVAFAAELRSSSGTDDQVRDTSLDGKFAMLLTKDEQGYKVQLVEVSSRRLVAELAENVAYPPVKRCELLGAPDSQRFAFYEANHRGGDTTVYFRNGSGFVESILPELENCATAAERKGAEGPRR